MTLRPRPCFVIPRRPYSASSAAFNGAPSTSSLETTVLIEGSHSSTVGRVPSTGSASLPTTTTFTSSSPSTSTWQSPTSTTIDPCSVVAAERQQGAVPTTDYAEDVGRLCMDFHAAFLRGALCDTLLSNLYVQRHLLRPGEAATILNHLARLRVMNPRNKQQTSCSSRGVGQQLWDGVVADSLKNLSLCESGDTLATLANAFAVANQRDEAFLKRLGDEVTQRLRDFEDWRSLVKETGMRGQEDGVGDEVNNTSNGTTASRRRLDRVVDNQVLISPRSVAMLVNAFGRLQIPHQEMLEAVSEYLVNRLVPLEDEQNKRTSKKKLIEEDENLIESVNEVPALHEQINFVTPEKLNAVDVANLVNGFAKLNYFQHEELFCALPYERLAPTFEQAHLAMIANALAKFSSATKVSCSPIVQILCERARAICMAKQEDNWPAWRMSKKMEVARMMETSLTSTALTSTSTGSRAEGGKTSSTSTTPPPSPSGKKTNKDKRANNSSPASTTSRTSSSSGLFLAPNYLPSFVHAIATKMQIVNQELREVTFLSLARADPAAFEICDLVMLLPCLPRLFPGGWKFRGTNENAPSSSRITSTSNTTTTSKIIQNNKKTLMNIPPSVAEVVAPLFLQAVKGPRRGLVEYQGHALASIMWAAAVLRLGDTRFWIPSLEFCALQMQTTADQPVAVTISASPNRRREARNAVIGNQKMNMGKQASVLFYLSPQTVLGPEFALSAVRSIQAGVSSSEDGETQTREPPATRRSLVSSGKGQDLAIPSLQVQEQSMSRGADVGQQSTTRNAHAEQVIGVVQRYIDGSVRVIQELEDIKVLAQCALGAAKWALVIGQNAHVLSVSQFFDAVSMSAKRILTTTPGTTSSTSSSTGSSARTSATTTTTRLQDLAQLATAFRIMDIPDQSLFDSIGMAFEGLALPVGIQGPDEDEEFSRRGRKPKMPTSCRGESDEASNSRKEVENKSTPGLDTPECNTGSTPKSHFVNKILNDAARTTTTSSAFSQQKKYEAAVLDAFVALELKHSSYATLNDRVMERRLETQEKSGSAAAFGTIVDVTEDGEREPDFVEI
ncbi:unnamed protein product [Amoebophrya sp. A25]|nr:unnamed protein product [Amoebophrya sp. A25]|eukprot:GSA25T00014072001.1